MTATSPGRSRLVRFLVRLSRRTTPPVPDALATLALRPNPNPKKYKPVVTDRTGRILSIRGLPAARKGTVSLFASVHIIEPVILERLPPGESDTVGDLYIPLLREGVHLQGVRQSGVWHDLGSPSGYLKAQM